MLVAKFYAITCSLLLPVLASTSSRNTSNQVLIIEKSGKSIMDNLVEAIDSQPSLIRSIEEDQESFQTELIPDRPSIAKLAHLQYKIEAIYNSIQILIESGCRFSDQDKTSQKRFNKVLSSLIDDPLLTICFFIDYNYALRSFGPFEIDRLVSGIRSIL